MATLILVSAVSTAVALLAWVFLLLLPAVYGIDPTGFGTLSGINRADGASVRQEAAALKQPARVQPPAPAVISATGGATTQAETMPDERQDIFNVTVPARQSQHFAFTMERDYELYYHWATDGKPLYCELHGQSQDGNGAKPKVFGKLKERKGKGFFIAPLTGKYTLSWENQTDKPVIIRLTVKGVYKPFG